MEGRDQKRSPSNVVDGLMELQRGDVVRLAASVTLAGSGWRYVMTTGWGWRLTVWLLRQCRTW